jgi:hypothetical protein
VGEDEAVCTREAGYCASLHRRSIGVEVAKGLVIHAGDRSKGCEKSELSAQHRVSLGMVLVGPAESLPESAMRAS